MREGHAVCYHSILQLYIVKVVRIVGLSLFPHLCLQQMLNR